MKFNLQGLLPSAAKSALTAHFLERLEGAKLNCYCDPMYEFADAIGEFRNEGGWVQSILHECFRAAEKEYNRLHLKGWDNERQEAFRYNLPKRD